MCTCTLYAARLEYHTVAIKIDYKCTYMEKYPDANVVTVALQSMKIMLCENFALYGRGGVWGGGALAGFISSCSSIGATLLKMGSYSSTATCQYWDKCLIY